MKKRAEKITPYKNTVITVLTLAVLVISCYLTGFSMNTLIHRGNRFIEFFGHMFPVDAGYSTKVFLPLVWTVQMSIAGTAIGALLALPTSFLCAKNMMIFKILRLPIKLVVQCVRTIPVLITALISTFVFGIGTFAGTFSLALYTWAIMTKIGSEDIENMSVSAYNAIAASGVGRAKAFVRTILVQMMSGYLSNALYLLETNVRHASILGYVGAGGIGLLLNEKISWREYQKVGTILIWLFAAVILIEILSVFLAGILDRRIVIAGWMKKFVSLTLIIVCIWSIVCIGSPDTSAIGMRVVGSMLNGIIHPDMAYMLSMGKDGVPFLLVETFCIAVAGTLIGAIIAAGLSFLNSTRFMIKPIALFFRLAVMAIRTIPVLIYGIMFLRVTGPGSFAGVLTLSLTSIGLITKRFTVSIDRMDMSAWNAYKVMGIGVIARVKYCLIPQLIPEFASAVLYRFDVNIRSASVLGLVGAGGIGAPLIMYMNQYRWDAVGSILIGLFVMVVIIEIISSALRKA